MLRQILLSLLVVVVAAIGYVYFVPGSTEQLAKLGIALPQAEGAAPAAGSQGAGGQAGRSSGGQAAQAPQRPAGGGGFGGRGGARTPVVVTGPVTTGKINDNLTAIGDGAAVRSATIVSPASGTLEDLVVSPGDMIAADAIIGHLDSGTEEIAYERAELAKQDAEASLARLKELASASNATSVQVAAAELTAKNAGLELQNAELALKRRTISSPVAGRVGLFQVTPGNAVTAQTVVTTVEDTSAILVSFWVPERYAAAVTPGMSVTATAVALPGETIAGEVSAVDNRIDQASRTLKVEARIANENGHLRPGMSFSVSMSFPGETFPAVDPLAIQWSSEGAYLWKYLDGKVERVPVTIIQRDSDGVLVKADLAEGDAVVTQGIQQLNNGAEVRLLDDVVAPAGRDGAKPS